MIIHDLFRQVLVLMLPSALLGLLLLLLLCIVIIFLAWIYDLAFWPSHDYCRWNKLQGCYPSHGSFGVVDGRDRPATVSLSKNTRTTSRPMKMESKTVHSRERHYAYSLTEFCIVIATLLKKCCANARQLSEFECACMRGSFSMTVKFQASTSTIQKHICAVL
jgi:hypothetical protein